MVNFKVLLMDEFCFVFDFIFILKIEELINSLWENVIIIIVIYNM